MLRDSAELLTVRHCLQSLSSAVSQERRNGTVLSRYVPLPGASSSVLHLVTLCFLHLFHALCYGPQKHSYVLFNMCKCCKLLFHCLEKKYCCIHCQAMRALWMVTAWTCFGLLTEVDKTCMLSFVDRSGQDLHASFVNRSGQDLHASFVNRSGQDLHASFVNRSGQDLHASFVNRSGQDLHASFVNRSGQDLHASFVNRSGQDLPALFVNRSGQDLHASSAVSNHALLLVKKNSLRPVWLYWDFFFFYLSGCLFSFVCGFVCFYWMGWLWLCKLRHIISVM